MSDYITNDNGTDRPMTPAEDAAYTASLPDLEAQDAAHAAAEADKAAAKAALLNKLGITADEAALLLG
jgi:hypothetical protein